MLHTSAYTKSLRGEVRSGVERRRRWTDEEKGRIVAEAIAPGVVISQVARRHALTPQHLGNWIRAAKRGRLALPGEGLTFVPVVAAEAADMAPMAPQAKAATIEIALCGAVVRLPAGLDARMLETTVRALKRALS